MSEHARPRQPIRRFDVFAEYNKLRVASEGRPFDEAKGYGLWLAKVVASRRYGASRLGRELGKQPRPDGHREKPAAEEHERFRSLGDEPQTDELFDREIVDRMGREFYAEVFAPAIAAAFDRGERYESIRDSIRKGWK